jgi:hypothetical protein
MLLPIANYILVIAWCVSVGLSFISPDFGYPFPNFFFILQKFVDFVTSSFVSPQNHVDNGKQLKGSLPFSNINVSFILDELKSRLLIYFQ